MPHAAGLSCWQTVAFFWPCPSSAQPCVLGIAAVGTCFFRLHMETLAANIASLVTQQREATAAKKVLQKTLKSARRRARRLRNKAKLLSTADLELLLSERIPSQGQNPNTVADQAPNLAIASSGQNPSAVADQSPNLDAAASSGHQPGSTADPASSSAAAANLSD